MRPCFLRSVSALSSSVEENMYTQRPQDSGLDGGGVGVRLELLSTIIDAKRKQGEGRKL